MLVVAMLQLAGNLLANMLGSWAEEMTATWLLPTAGQVEDWLAAGIKM